MTIVIVSLDPVILDLGGPFKDRVNQFVAGGGSEPGEEEHTLVNGEICWLLD